ncbi:transglycosylase domain-containing protein [Neobittarella massiliensis]|uniref:transglycosylase domain-containing protein n=1 Tax=Neobittarella massiliensis (ex Bilen et al. 2018) TaxID=2041842 RepID=UPI0013EB617B|nr:transglycosylase domain-containing protein [Neobittarella massiliensis]
MPDNKHLSGPDPKDRDEKKALAANGKTDKQSKKTKKPKKEVKLNKKGKKRLRDRTWFRVVLSIFMVCVIVGSVAATSFVMYVFSTMKDDDQLLDLDKVKLPYTTIIYGQDAAGNEVELTRLESESNRIYVSIDQIPKHMQNAVIAIEDERFRSHKGVDWKRTIAATVNEIVPIFSNRQGGSTITQQLIKNITNDRSTNALEGYARKAREIFRALNLEKTYSKDRILEAYLNTFHLGNGTDGVQAAANLYFNKDISQVSIAEAACLAGITQAPSAYDPFTNPEANKKRQLQVLAKMYELEFITKEEYEAAKNEELVFNTAAANQGTKIESYYVDYVIEQVSDDLEKLGYSEEDAISLIYTGGLRIHTPMDTSVQSYLESYYQDDSNFPSDPGRNLGEEPQSAAVVMDVNGNIVGMVGGRGVKETNRGFNRAVSPRPPGSSIKPIASYGPAIDRDLVNWSTILEDQPVRGNWPKNYYNAYRGKMTVEEGLKKSVNTLAVRVLQKVGITESFQHLRDNLGVTTLAEEDDPSGVSDYTESSLGLGGMAYGISPLEMAAAYVPFTTGGVYYQPRCYTKVEDQFGNSLLDKSNPTTKQALSPAGAKVMNQMLQQVLRAGGTASGYGFGYQPQGGKTGTSTDEDGYAHDIWFVGFSPYYVTSVWWGYDFDTNLNEDGYVPAGVWQDVMGHIHEGLAYKDFPSASGVTTRTYCVKSGKLASDTCKEKATGWYKTSNVPTETCDGTECLTDEEKKQKEEEEKKKKQEEEEASRSASISASKSASISREEEENKNSSSASSSNSSSGSTPSNGSSSSSSSGTTTKNKTAS